MIRTLFLGLALLSVPTILAPPAFAATPEELDRLKSEADVATDKLKTLEKLADAFDKNIEKEKDNTETNKEIREYLVEELSKLRKLGIPTNPEDESEELGKPDEEVSEEERAKLIELRDLCVKLKNHKAGEKDKPFAKDLRAYVAVLNERADRRTKRYEKEKEASK